MRPAPSRDITRLLGRLGQFLHQSALAAGGVIFVDDTFFGRFIQLFNSSEHRGSRNCLISTFQRQASFLNKGTCTPTENAVVNAPFFILPVPLDLRLNVCQSTSSNRI